MNKDVRELARHLRGLGYRTQLRGGHVLVQDSLGASLYALPSTPSDHRWRRNAVTDLMKRGILASDPKKLGQKKKVLHKGWTGGEAPPPLPTIRKVDDMPTASSGLVVTPKMKEDALKLFRAIEQQYDLSIRSGRITGHGAVPVLAQVLEAYEAETKEPIPSFDYKGKRDDDDRVEMGRLCANRAADLAANVHIGTGISKVSVDGLHYCMAAWEWHGNEDFVFPDGRKVYRFGQGVVVDHLEVAPDGIGAEDEVLAQEALVDMGVHQPLAFPDELEIKGSSVTAERARLAIEVAARIRNPRDAFDLALRVLEA